MAFWGIAEHYTASFCLLLYQVGHERFSECRAAGALGLSHSNDKDRFGPAHFELSLSDDELRAAGARDSELFALLKQEFVRRVRWVEHQTGVSFLREGPNEAPVRDQMELMRVLRTVKCTMRIVQ